MEMEIMCAKCHGEMRLEEYAGKILVEPCANCLKKEKADAYTKGHGEGYDYGYDEGYQEAEG